MGKGSSALGKRDTGRSRKLPFEDGCPHFDLEGAGAAALTLCPRNNQGLSQLDPNRPPRRGPPAAASVAVGGYPRSASDRHTPTEIQYAVHFVAPFATISSGREGRTNDRSARSAAP